jgi:hypothetical protein
MQMATPLSFFLDKHGTLLIKQHQYTVLRMHSGAKSEKKPELEKSKVLAKICAASLRCRLT